MVNGNYIQVYTSSRSATCNTISVVSLLYALLESLIISHIALFHHHACLIQKVRCNQQLVLIKIFGAVLRARRVDIISTLPSPFMHGTSLDRQVDLIIIYNRLLVSFYNDNIGGILSCSSVFYHRKFSLCFVLESMWWRRRHSRTKGLALDHKGYYNTQLQVTVTW